MKKHNLGGITIVMLILFFFSGCMEPRYEQRNHERYERHQHRYQRNHRPAVELKIHN